MARLGLQLQNTAYLEIESGDPVLFNETLVSADSNVTYNPADGTIAFAEDGQYYVSWFVVTKTALGTLGTDFSIVTNEATPTQYTAGSGFKNGTITGSALLMVTAGAVISLINTSEAGVSLSDVVQVNAGISVLNAGEAGPIGPTGPTVTSEGFSAFLSAVSVSTSAQLTGWSVSDPYFNSGNFKVSTGNYTVPVTGRYIIQATINYTTTAAISIALGAGINPAFVVRRTSPTSTNLITGLFPILNVSIALLLSLRTILGNGTVTLTGEVQLKAGDVIGLYYIADGLTVNLSLGGASGGIVWSVNQIY